MNQSNRMRGIFLSFEGIDGAGKSSHIDALAQEFRAQGKVVTVTREPGGTALAEQLRTMILNEPMDPMTEAFLVFAARRDHLLQVIAPGLARGEVVLCDRFTDSTFAYQGGGRGFDDGVLRQLEQWVQGTPMAGLPLPAGQLLQPTLTLWFDLPSSIAAQRLVSARVPDKFESQSIAFFDKVSQGYSQRMAADPDRFVRINANQSPELVRADVVSAVICRGLLTP